jgi:DNA-binding GntR family transcriptional regulator
MTHRATRVKTVRKPIRSLRDEVYERLRTLLNEGRLQPGNYLDLNALAKEIGISRTPLRDALLRLEGEGFVEIHNRRGVCIAELTLERIQNLYELLGALESTALRQVAPRITGEVVGRMSELNGEMASALDAGDFDRFYAANLAFHDCYRDLSGNAELVRQIYVLKQRLYDFPRLKRYVPEWERASIGEHQAIVRLLEQGKVADAADLLRDVHWSFTYQEPFIRRYYLVRNGKRADS